MLTDRARETLSHLDLEYDSIDVLRELSERTDGRGVQAT
jgi:hypothetical protein